MNQDGINLSDAAVERLAYLKRQEGEDDKMFRISVNGGGCSGFTYSFSFDDQLNDDDLTFEKGGVVAVIDEMSLELLSGSQVDYVEGIVGSAFQISNPNATASCGCGSSFAI